MLESSGRLNEELAEFYEHEETEVIFRETPLGALYDYERACHAQVIATGTTPRVIPDDLRQSLSPSQIGSEMLDELEHVHENRVGILVDGEYGGQIRVKNVYKMLCGNELLRLIEAFGGDDNGKH